MNERENIENLVRILIQYSHDQKVVYENVKNLIASAKRDVMLEMERTIANKRAEL